jgi:hypothetical protein
MVKGKVASKAIGKGLKKLSKTKVGKGAQVAAAVNIADEVAENKYAQAGIGAIEGAALGAAFGPAGAVGGAIVGGAVGFLLADGERIAPVDLIAIPAYQYSAMLAGREPTFQLYIKEGEMISPTQPTDYQIGGAIALAEEIEEVEPPKRKLSAWQRYIKQDKNKIYYKSGPKKGRLNFSAMSKKYKRGNN